MFEFALLVGWFFWFVMLMVNSGLSKSAIVAVMVPIAFDIIMHVMATNRNKQP